MTPHERDKAFNDLEAALARRAEADSDVGWADYLHSVASTELAECEAAVDKIDAQRRVWAAEDDVRRLLAQFPECRYPWPVPCPPDDVRRFTPPRQKGL